VKAPRTGWKCCKFLWQMVRAAAGCPSGGLQAEGDWPVPWAGPAARPPSYGLAAGHGDWRPARCTYSGE
jgi:hypothetical protein